MSQRAESPSATWKEPTQRRSRERVERMLAVASEMIADKGSDVLRMGDVAAKAGVSIGSLYQFFPDKSAIIRALAERQTAAGRACIDDALAGIETQEELATAFAGLVDVYYRMFLDNPVTRDVWSGMQADRTLREIELADSRANAEALVAALQRIEPHADAGQLWATAFLIWQLGEATMRLAVSVGRAEGDLLVETYKRMALRELAQA